MSKNLNDYVTLGRSGLRVSPLCLGTRSCLWATVTR